MFTLLGLLVGAGLVQAAHVIRDRRSAKQLHTQSEKEIFERRLNCREVAEAYAKKQSGVSGRTTVVASIDRVDFSRVRNSCIASISRDTEAARGAWRSFELIDLLSEEVVFGGQCFLNDNPRLTCGNGRDMAIIDERDKAFERALGTPSVNPSGQAR